MLSLYLTKELTITQRTRSNAQTFHSTSFPTNTVSLGHANTVQRLGLTLHKSRTKWGFGSRGEEEGKELACHQGGQKPVAALAPRAWCVVNQSKLNEWGSSAHTSSVPHFCFPFTAQCQGCLPTPWPSPGTL